MKPLIKLMLVLSLFGSVAFADGDMGGGNLVCPPEGCPPPPPPACSENCGGLTGVLLDGTGTVSDTIVASTGLAIDFVNDTLGLF